MSCLAKRQEKFKAWLRGRALLRMPLSRELAAEIDRTCKDRGLKWYPFVKAVLWAAVSNRDWRELVAIKPGSGGYSRLLGVPDLPRSGDA